MNTLIKNINTQRRWLLKSLALPLFTLLLAGSIHAQSNFTGDGFGGRSWYVPHNFEVGNGVASINVNGQLYMWGSFSGIGTVGEVPLPNTTMKPNASAGDLNTPGFVFTQAISSLNNVKLVSLTHTGGAIKTDGSGWVWSQRNSLFVNTSNNLPTNIFTMTPQMVIPNNCKQVCAHYEAISFLKNDGTVWSVGLNGNGKFGNGSAASTSTTTPSLTPVQMSITNAVRISAFTSVIAGRDDDNGILILKNDGTVWMTGRLGVVNAGTGNALTPVQIAGFSNIVDIKGGVLFAAALDATGSVYISKYKENFIPRKLTFPAGAKPIVAIIGKSDEEALYCLDEGHVLWYVDGRGASTSSYVAGSAQSGPPISTDGRLSARFVADASMGQQGTAQGSVSYLTHTTDYPAEDRVWVNIFASGALSGQIFKLNDGTGIESLGKTPTSPETWGGMNDAIWIPTHLADVGLPVNPSFTDTTAGTIDCSKTQLYPAPVAGTKSQIDLIVTVNVTKPGCFTPLSVSGSGFSIASGFTQKCVTATGIQQLHIPVNYDGSTLGTLTFTVGQAGTCTADLTKQPADKLVKLWTLDNCTLKNAPPALK